MPPKRASKRASERASKRESEGGPEELEGRPGIALGDLDADRGQFLGQAKTAGVALAKGRALLRGNSEHPARDAALLLAHVLDKPAEYPHLHPEAHLLPEEERCYLTLIERRRKGEPVAYLCGYREFMGVKFRVDPRVLIPRPETEILVGMAEEELRRRRGPCRIADVGCGSGAIGLSLALRLPSISVVLTDLSPDALEVAMDNAVGLGVLSRVTFLQGDLVSPLLKAGSSCELDAVVSNPPYIPNADMDDLPRDVRDFEPHVALNGGRDGLLVVRRMAREAPAVLKPGGYLFVEIGDGQGDECRAVFSETGMWQDFDVIPDYSGRQRVVTARTIFHRGDTRAD